MKNIIILIILITTTSFALEKPVYNSWEKILKTYVCENGVDYNGIKNNPIVLEVTDKEFKSLTENDFNKLTQDQQLAWLINLYNFYTIKLIVNNLPLKVGIRDITKPWDKKIVPFLGKNVSLNHIEHQIIRKKYDEPEIHFALVCASKGCPPLINEVFTGDNLVTLLKKQGKVFLSDTSRNKVEGNKLFLSEIFSWYGSDFKKKHGSYKKYITKTLNLDGKYSVKYLPYDWGLNISKKCNN